jgi:hypothetical protein
MKRAILAVALLAASSAAFATCQTGFDEYQCSNEPNPPNILCIAHGNQPPPGCVSTASGMVLFMVVVGYTPAGQPPVVTNVNATTQEFTSVEACEAARTRYKNRLAAVGADFRAWCEAKG